MQRSIETVSHPTVQNRHISFWQNHALFQSHNMPVCLTSSPHAASDDNLRRIDGKIVLTGIVDTSADRYLFLFHMDLHFWVAVRLITILILKAKTR